MIFMVRWFNFLASFILKFFCGANERYIDKITDINGTQQKCSILCICISLVMHQTRGGMVNRTRDGGRMVSGIDGILELGLKNKLFK